MTDPATTGEYDAKEPTEAGRWHEALKRAEKAETDYRARCEKILKLYRKQRSQAEGQRRFAMLWANVEVLKPATYARPPQPVVTRRFKDRDPVGREASEMLERTLSTANDLGNDDAIYRQCRDDYLLYARGTAWIRYDATVESVPGPDGQPVEQITDEKAPLEHVYRKDFLHGEARTWEEVPWVARRVWLSEKQWKKRFQQAQEEGPAKGPKFILPKQETDADTNEKPRANKAAVWEVWSRTESKVCWVSLEHTDILEEAEPHLKFDGFFPCPRPLYGTLTTEGLIPTPDYIYYQDQAEEIDDLTARIAKLQDQLKLVGFYPGGSENAGQIEKALEPGVENKMIAVDSWAAFAEKGSAGSIVWLPIKDVAEVIQACIELRRQLTEDVYQITGISDIVRGDTDPNETLGAQELKGQYASVRIKDRQQEMARFTRDVQRLRAEIIAENYQPSTLVAMSGKQLPSEQEVLQGQASGQLPQGQPPPVTMDAVVKLLRDQRMRGFRVDVETDSTIAPDEAAEREQWNLLLTSVAAFLQQAIPAIQAAPPMLPFLAELLTATVRKFRAGRSVEDVLQQAVDQMTQASQQQQGQAPNPEAEAAAAKAEADKAKAATDAQAAQAKLLQTQEDHKVAMAEMELTKELKNIELQLAAKKLEQANVDATNEAALKRLEIELHAKKLELAKTEVANNAELSRQTHRQGLEQLREKAKTQSKAA